eukprot:scaffold48472_cov42-Cyclotella_meneghiniana.AAC.3
MSNQCASCGKAAANLKACKACKLVRYCGVECQVAHRPAHKKACREKARELFHVQLFAQTKREEECPICMIPLPCYAEECTYMVCCGKQICIGCRYCLTRNCCPFCNTADPTSPEEVMMRLSERIEKYNDPEAMVLLAIYHSEGRNGLPVDKSKAFELLQRACELGCAEAHFHLGLSYDEGVGVELDKKKAIHNYQIAAMMGHMGARHNLGSAEYNDRNYECATKHFMIAAKCGYQLSLNEVKQCFKEGLVTKEDFERTLRDYQASCDETKSEQRDRAAVIKARERE